MVPAVLLLARESLVKKYPWPEEENPSSSKLLRCSLRMSEWADAHQHKQAIQRHSRRYTLENTDRKQNYPGSVDFYDTRPGNDVCLFYNAPESTRGSSIRRAQLEVPAMVFLCIAREQPTTTFGSDHNIQLQEQAGNNINWSTKSQYLTAAKCKSCHTHCMQVSQ